MTQEDKQLLRKDLYARQSYGVKVSLGRDRMSEYIEPEAETCLTLYYINPQRLECVFKECWWTAYIGSIRPYLRPMSSMTEEESKDFAMLQTDYYSDGWLYPIAAINMLDWLNAHHFDYRGLIHMGLALEAKDWMYKTKQDESNNKTESVQD